MKLELNMPALERLIGGDSEIELELRKQIVQEFAKRHLISVAEIASYQAVVEAVKQHVNAYVKEQLGIENLLGCHWPTMDQRLSYMIKDLVDKRAQAAVDEALKKVIEYQKNYWPRDIERVVKKELERRIEEEVEKGIRQRLGAAAKLVPEQAAGKELEQLIEAGIDKVVQKRLEAATKLAPSSPPG